MPDAINIYKQTLKRGATFTHLANTRLFPTRYTLSPTSLSMQCLSRSNIQIMGAKPMVPANERDMTSQSHYDNRSVSVTLLTLKVRNSHFIQISSYVNDS